MRIGVPREIKPQEYRVALTPIGVRELTDAGHTVLVEHDAGAGSAIPDAEYHATGATIVPTADDVWAEADLIVKVKEPIAEEYPRLRRGQLLFTFLHLAASAECTSALLAAGVTAIAYETVRLPDGRLPLLAPMSEIAGRLAVQEGAYHLKRTAGGRGILLGGMPGVPPATVVVLGAGVAGSQATEIAVGLGARVVVLDTNLEKLRHVYATYHGRVETLAARRHTIVQACREADLVIGAVLVPGARAPILVDKETIAEMRPGSVLVDVSIDQGGCFAPSRPTTHADPTFPVADSLLYCVANMPGAVPRTATYALTNATLPYVEAIANLGLAAACEHFPELTAGITTVAGRLTAPEVGQAHGLPVTPLAEALAR